MDTDEEDTRILLMLQHAERLYQLEPALSSSMSFQPISAETSSVVANGSGSRLLTILDTSNEPVSSGLLETLQEFENKISPKKRARIEKELERPAESSHNKSLRIDARLLSPPTPQFPVTMATSSSSSEVSKPTLLLTEEQIRYVRLLYNN